MVNGVHNDCESHTLGFATAQRCCTSATSPLWLATGRQACSAQIVSLVVQAPTSSLPIKRIQVLSLRLVRNKATPVSINFPNFSPSTCPMSPGALAPEAKRPDPTLPPRPALCRAHRQAIAHSQKAAASRTVDSSSADRGLFRGLSGERAGPGSSSQGRSFGCGRVGASLARSAV